MGCTVTTTGGSSAENIYCHARLPRFHAPHKINPATANATTITIRQPKPSSVRALLAPRTWCLARCLSLFCPCMRACLRCRLSSSSCCLYASYSGSYFARSLGSLSTPYASWISCRRSVATGSPLFALDCHCFTSCIQALLISTSDAPN